MKKSFTLLTMLLFFAIFQEVYAQESEREGEFTFSGSIDTYFRANLDAKNSGENYQTPGTSFANLPGFGLGMINLVGTYQEKRGGFVADLAFGPRGEDAVFASPYYSSGRGSSQMINQLYAYWNITDVLTMSLGNFNTFLGYEVISPVGNFNYSTSYMFSYGPFSHTGLKVDFQVSEDVSLMASVMNPTDFTEFNPFGSYTAGLQIGLFGHTFINFLYGDQDGKIDVHQLTTTSSDGFSAGNTFQADITTGFGLSEAFYLGLNATYNTTDAGEEYTGTEIQQGSGNGAGFYGGAAYLQISASEAFSVGTRLEYFKVFNHGLEVVTLDTDGDGHVLDITLSANARMGNLTIIPELRLDATSETSFLNRDMEADSYLGAFILAAVYSF